MSMSSAASSRPPSSALRPRISAVINTLNEERRLAFALRSVRPWVDEIVVVDMHSDDATTEIAGQFGARVFMHDRLQYADPARAFALAQATGDWILLLDADEVIPAPLSERLRQVAAEGQYDVVVIPWVNYLLGAPLWHTGWGPTQDHHERFFRRDAVVAHPSIHGFLEIQAGSRILELGYEERLAVVHFNYVDISHFLDKLNRYTDAEAERLLSDNGAGSARRASIRAVRHFIRRYVRWRGYRDGWRGFYLSVLMAMYQIVVAAKVREVQDHGGRSAVEAAYRDVAERLLSAYGPAAEDPNAGVK